MEEELQHSPWESCSLEENLWPTWQCIKKQRHHFANKGPSTQSYGFSSSYIRMWELDHKEDWAEELMLSNCGIGEDSWESLGQKRDQSVLKEINSEQSLLGLILKLKLHYFGHMIWRANSLEKTLMLGKIGDRIRGLQQKMRRLNRIISSMDMSLSKLQ